MAMSRRTSTPLASLALKTVRDCSRPRGQPAGRNQDDDVLEPVALDLVVEVLQQCLEAGIPLLMIRCCWRTGCLVGTLNAHARGCPPEEAVCLEAGLHQLDPLPVDEAREILEAPVAQQDVGHDAALCQHVIISVSSSGSGLMNRVRRPPKVAEVRPGMESRLSSSSNPRSTFRLAAIPGAFSFVKNVDDVARDLAVESNTNVADSKELVEGLVLRTAGRLLDQPINQALSAGPWENRPP